jgi:L-ribulose-5-phosphate 3-epimerase
MQGRLSPQVNGKIQAFPWAHWREEFATAEPLGFRLLEWTLDHERLAENPLMTAAGRAEIQTLSVAHRISIPSLTGDCFMQAPFWKATSPELRRDLLEELDKVIEACGLMQIGLIVVPLVDNGRMVNELEKQLLVKEFTARGPLLERARVRIAFETDLSPRAVADWIGDYPKHLFGINYDTGNSASLGYDPEEEWTFYGDRVFNVHLKDRLREGATVTLGEGSCDFSTCLRAMRRSNYAGNFILQTARAVDGKDAEVLARYRDFIVTRIQEAELT